MESAFLIVFLAAIVIFIAIVIAASRFTSPGAKGARGEAWVASHLTSALNTDDYIILNDLTLPTHNGTTQIDHVIVSRFGIFVIETKNMDGWIFGDARSARWMQTLYHHKSQFQNPLRQNYRHIKAVQEFLSIRMSHIHNVVAFVGSAEPRTDMPENVVWDVWELEDYIKSWHTIVFSKAQIADFSQSLRTGALPADRETQAQHVYNLRKEAWERQSGTPKCPRCGAPMVERRNKESGNKFYGCPKFPQCRGIRRSKNA